MSAEHWLIRRLRERVEAPAMTDSCRSWTAGELVAETGKLLQEWPHAGLCQGDRVAIVGEHGGLCAAALLASAAMGLIAIPLAPGARAEVATRLRIAACGWIAREENGALTLEKCDENSEPPALLRQLASAERPGLVLFSSGSTGEPKAMVHDMERFLAPFEERRERALVMLVLLLFDHIGGLNTLFHALATGAHLVAPGTRDPERVAAALAAHRVQVLPASPTFLNLLLVSGAVERHDLSALRLITYGTEPMPESLLRRLREALPRARFVQTFGTSETGIAQTRSASSESLLLKLEDTEWKVVEGELWLKSRTQVLGYLNAPQDRFTEDGWFRTGDLVEEKEDGYLRIIGRKSEVINVGGEKVLPTEVESVLLEHPQVADCLVYAEPNALTGQVVAARFLPAHGADGVRLRTDLRRHCREHLAAYKVPVRLRLQTGALHGERMKKSRVRP